jgi:hypothetical protein
VIFARALVHLRDGQSSHRPKNNSSGDIDASKSVDIEPETDEEDPDLIIDSYSNAALKATKVDYDRDSDEDLQPYEIHDDDSDTDQDVDTVKQAKVTAPLYLRDLLSYIRANEDRRKTEIGLEMAAKLLRRNVGSLEIGEFFIAVF